MALDSELVEETLLLPSDIEHGNGSIDFASEMWIEPDDFTEGVDQAGLCGYRAVLVADRLRIKYQLPTYRKLTSQWDFRAVLEEYHDKKLANYEAMSKYA